MPDNKDAKTIVVTGASSGFGAMSVRALGGCGHTVYAGMRGTTDHNTSAVTELDADANEAGSDLRAIEMNVSDQASVDKAVNQVIAECGHIDGIAALDAMERHLRDREFFVAGRYIIADIALYAYTHVAPEGGSDLGSYPAVKEWLTRVAAQPEHIPITA